MRLKGEEADHLGARSRTPKGVVEKLEHTREGNNLLRKVAFRARTRPLANLRERD